MTKKLTALAIAALAINFAWVTPALAQTDQDAQRLAKVKQAVNKIGIDERARISLLDGTKLKGRITEIGEDYFVLAPEKTESANRIKFAQVKQAKPIAENPFGDPGLLMGLGLIPVILALAVLGGRD
jgi:hypothetical protein